MIQVGTYLSRGGAGSQESVLSGDQELAKPPMQRHITCIAGLLVVFLLHSMHICTYASGLGTQEGVRVSNNNRYLSPLYAVNIQKNRWYLQSLTGTTPATYLHDSRYLPSVQKQLRLCTKFTYSCILMPYSTQMYQTTVRHSARYTYIIFPILP